MGATTVENRKVSLVIFEWQIHNLIFLLIFRDFPDLVDIPHR